MMYNVAYRFIFLIKIIHVYIFDGRIWPFIKNKIQLRYPSVRGFYSTKV